MIYMVSEEELAKFFSAMSDPTRLRIIAAISSNGMNVNSISRKMKITMPAVSHQLKHLYDLGLVKYEKKGREKIYKISDNHVRRIMKEGIDHIEKLPN